MRLICGMIGVIIVAVGTIAVVTGDFAVDGGGSLPADLRRLGVPDSWQQQREHPDN